MQKDNKDNKTPGKQPKNDFNRLQNNQKRLQNDCNDHKTKTIDRNRLGKDLKTAEKNAKGSQSD